MSDLTSGQQKIVEIAKALVSKSNVIILDEPTASFSSREIDTVLNIVKTVKKDGIGVIYISHHLDEVFEIGDRATVLRDGRKVSMYPIAGLTKTTLIKDMVGRDPSTFYKRERVERGEAVLEVRNVTGNGVRNVSFELHRGEILGIAGMVGSGRSELMEVLFGSAPLVYGEIVDQRQVGQELEPEERDPQQDVLHHRGPSEHRPLSAEDDRRERRRGEHGEHARIRRAAGERRPSPARSSSRC